jgi:hypothetical protein
MDDSSSLGSRSVLLSVLYFSTYRTVPVFIMIVLRRYSVLCGYGRDLPAEDRDAAGVCSGPGDSHSHLLPQENPPINRRWQDRQGTVLPDNGVHH